MRQVFLTDEFAGKGLCTEGLQALIDRAAEVGGQVRFTPGIYETATLYMKSGVSLFIDGGARIVATDDYRLFSNTFPVEGHPDLQDMMKNPRWHDAVIFGNGLHDIAIEGYGVIDGAYVINPEGEQNFRGPMVLSFYNCHNVRVSGITLVRGANYFTMFDECTDVLVENIRTFGGQDSVEVWRSERVEIAGCDFRCGDDAILGCRNRDIYVHDTRINTPSGCATYLGCINFHMKDCKVWASGQSAAIFNERKRYSHTLNGITLFHRNFVFDDSYIMSDNWLIENVEYENVETILMYNNSSPYGRGNNGKIVLRNIKATNFLRPITINAYPNSDFDLTIEDSTFIRAPYDVKVGFEDMPTDDKAFIRAHDFKKITLSNLTIEGVCDDAFHFSDGGEVVMKNISLIKKVETADIKNVEKSSVTNDMPKTDGKFFIYDDVTSIYVPKEQDESFLGAMKYVK